MAQPIISPEVVADAIARWKKREAKDLRKYLESYEFVQQRELYRMQLDAARANPFLSFMKM